jgi:hypothetical protein
MKTYSPFQLETYQVMGRKLHINFNEQFVEGSEDMDDQYVYDTAVIPDKLAKRDSIIEAIMATKYPTFGSELAAIRNGGTEAEEHGALRIKAKELADGWLE